MTGTSKRQLMIQTLILEFLLSASPELEDIICHTLEAFSQRRRTINVKWMFSQAQWLFKCYKWFRKQHEGRKKTPWEPGLCRSRAAERRNARVNKPAPVSATVINYHPFGSPENFFNTHMKIMDDRRNAGNNCSLCSHCTWRESKEWHKVEFQISKAIVHFPPCEGMHTFVIIKSSFISQAQLTGAMATFKQA